VEQLTIVNNELETKVTQLVAENVKQKEKFDLLKSDFETKFAMQEEEIRLLKKKYAADNIKLAQHAIDINAGNHMKSDSSLRVPPSSCRQLSTIGHNLDGLYLIANPDTNKIEDFTLANTVIPFDIERLNVGGAMDLATGVFTVPVDGIYHFEFTGMKDLNAAFIFIYLQVNGITIGESYATELPNYLTLSGISASLRLKIGDQVRLYKTGGTLNDAGRYTHFTGWLVEEDLVLG